jgi:hypothetical protein
LQPPDTIALRKKAFNPSQREQNHLLAKKCRLFQLSRWKVGFVQQLSLQQKRLPAQPFSGYVAIIAIILHCHEKKEDTHHDPMLRLSFVTFRESFLIQPQLFLQM